MILLDMYFSMCHFVFLSEKNTEVNFVSNPELRMLSQKQIIHLLSLDCYFDQYYEWKIDKTKYFFLCKLNYLFIKTVKRNKVLLNFLKKSLTQVFSKPVCVCVCVWERERERELGLYRTENILLLLDLFIHSRLCITKINLYQSGFSQRKRTTIIIMEWEIYCRTIKIHNCWRNFNNRRLEAGGIREKSFLSPFLSPSLSTATSRQECLSNSW